jgi:polyhydroxyalkanoate synthesis repressor PhaR
VYVPSPQGAALPAPEHLHAFSRPADRPRRLIKRYLNRKLYDTRTSAYVNLTEIGEMIREGEEVEVREAETNRDLTGMVLAHLISAEERKGARGGGRVLADLIRHPAVRAAASSLSIVPPCPPDAAAAPSKVDARTDQLLNEGHRLTACLRTMTAASREAVSRLQGQSSARADASHDVVAALARVKRELTRIARTIDVLHDRLHHLEG